MVEIFVLGATPVNRILCGRTKSLGTEDGGLTADGIKELKKLQPAITMENNMGKLLIENKIFCNY